MQVEAASENMSGQTTGPSSGLKGGHSGGLIGNGAAIKISSEAEVVAREAELAASLDRSNLYTSLGALMMGPATEEHCAVLRQLPEIESPESPMEIAWTMLRKSASDYASDEIDNEYHRLFIGLGRGEIVPYGSWHLTGFLMEKPLGHLRSDLRKLGFERNEGVAESEDHIASLCQAMAAIILAEEIDFKTECAFFNEHVASWAGDFFKLVQDANNAGFYRAVGFLGESFINVEKQYLGMAV